MRSIRVWLSGAMALVAVLAIACGGGGNADGGDDSPVVVAPGGGLVAPNTFLSFEGKRYELVYLLQADMVIEREFRAVGATVDADIDFEGSLMVYERTNDREAVYTLSPATQDDVAFWLRWALKS